MTNMAFSMYRTLTYWLVISVFLAYSKAHQGVLPRQGMLFSCLFRRLVHSSYISINTFAYNLVTTGIKLIHDIAFTNTTSVGNATRSTSTTTSNTLSNTQSTISAINATCPTTYPAAYPVEYTTFTTTCQYQSSWSQWRQYYNFADTCLREYCLTSQTANWELSDLSIANYL